MSLMENLTQGIYTQAYMQENYPQAAHLFAGEISDKLNEFKKDNGEMLKVKSRYVLFDNGTGKKPTLGVFGEDVFNFFMDTYAEKIFVLEGILKAEIEGKKTQIAGGMDSGLKQVITTVVGKNAKFTVEKGEVLYYCKFFKP